MTKVLFRVVINDRVEIVRDWPWDKIVQVKEQLKRLGFRWTGESWKGKVLSFSTILKLRDLLDLRPSEIRKILETCILHNEGGAVGIEVSDPSLLPDDVRECIIDSVENVQIVSISCYVRNFIKKDTKYLGKVESFEQYVDTALQTFRKQIEKFPVVGNLELAIERAKEFVLESPRARELYERRVAWWTALLHENFVELNFLKKGLLKELKESLKIKYNKVDAEGNIQEVLIPAIKRENVIKTADGKWRIYFPQFFKSKVAEILRSLGYVVKEVEYKPRTVSNIVDKVTLLPFQEKALQKWIENNYRGTIVIPTGGGKTFIALKAIAKLKVRTLILVITEELLEQWHERIYKYLGYRAGRLSGKYDELREITVCTYHTAVKRIDELRDYFDLVIADECLVEGTLVILKDGGAIPIERVYDGYNVFLGGTVKNSTYFRKEVNKICEIVTDFDIIRTTLTHPHVVLCKSTGTLKVKKAHELMVGDYLLIPEELPHNVKQSVSYDYLEHVVQSLDRDTCNIENIDKLFYAPRAALRKLLCDIYRKFGYVEDGCIVLNIESRDYLKRVQLLLLKFGIVSKLLYSGNTCSLKICGKYCSKFFREILHESRFVDSRHDYDPDIRRIRIGNINFVAFPIRDIRILEGSFKVYDFTTDTHLFVADGFLTHNCHHVPAETFKEVMLNMSAPYRMALSATVERSDGNEHLIYLACGELVYRTTYRELIKEGLVVPVRHYRIYVDLSDEEREEYEKAKNVLQLRNIAARASAKVDVACRIAEFEYELGSKVLIFTQYVNQAEEIYKKLRERVRNVALVTGETRDRDLVLKQFAKGNVRIIVATTVLDEGVDVPDADVAIIVSGTGSSRQMIQRVGRVVRAAPGKKEARVYEIVARRTIEEALSENRHPKEEIEEIECVKVLAKDLERLLRRIRARILQTSAGQSRIST